MSEAVTRIQQALEAGLPDCEPALLAVSGGVDSMVMLHAAISVCPPAQLRVATFDHGSGPHAARAVELVVRAAMSASVSVVVGRAEAVERPSEAAWRDQRLAFLRAAAVEHRAKICMAHTRDDQAETVLFREMRGAGARGLAGLAAPGNTCRPLLDIPRADIADYAAVTGVEWMDDPTNLDPAFARNRLRHEVIPALRAARPAIESDLVEIGRRAAAWRADLDAFIESRMGFSTDREGERLDVPTATLSGLSEDALAIVWPALLARIGVAADWRGTRRLVVFTTRGSTGQRIQLSGGWTVHRRREGFEVRRDGRPIKR